MAREVRNVGASVRARLLNLAKERRIDFQLLAIRYALERLLYRLSLSAHRDRFVLKGAMLYPIWLDDLLRPTRDLDFLAYGDDDLVAMEAVIREVCSLQVPDDGVVFDVDQIRADRIREDAQYCGIRVRTEAALAGARLPIRIDIGFGDAVTPRIEQIDYPVLLGAPAPRLRSYPRETVVAEKLQAIVALGAANSRMKDFYDLWLLSRIFAFDGRTLSDAIGATFARRRTSIPAEVPIGLTDQVVGSAEKQAQWRGFLKREPLAQAPKELSEVAAVIREFLMPLARAARNGDELEQWLPGGPWMPVRSGPQ